MLARYYTLLLGVAFILAGVGGFIPFVTPPPPSDTLPLVVDTNYGYLLGLFPVNVIHTLYHLAVGVWGVLAYRQASTTRFYLRAMAMMLGIFVIMGMLPALNTAFGLMPLFGHDIWLHGLEAIGAAYFGFLAAPEAAHTLKTS